MRSIWRTIDRQIRRAIVLMCLSVGMIGISYGASAVAAGFPVWLPVATASLVVAGSSEFLFVGIIAGGGNPFAAAFAGLLVNARHVPYGLALPDVLGSGWRRALGTHVMNDESVVFALSQPDPERQRGTYWISGLGVLLCWPVGALLGAEAATFVHNTDAFGLDAMFPAVILALILPALKDKTTRHAALAGSVVALAVFAFTPAGLPELLALAGAAFVLLRMPKQSLASTRPGEHEHEHEAADESEVAR